MAYKKISELVELTAEEVTGDELLLLADTNTSKSLKIQTVIDSIAEAIFDEKSLNQPGALTKLTGNSRWYPTRDITISSISPSVGTAPVGANIMIVVKKNDINILSSELIILDGENVGISQVPIDTSVTTIDYITVDVTQVGITNTGRDLLVNFKYK